jgi:hypothetical protein
VTPCRPARVSASGRRPSEEAAAGSEKLRQVLLHPAGLRAPVAQLDRARLFEPGAVVEVHIPDHPRTNAATAGYFDDWGKLAAAALSYSGHCHGVYVTLNEINPALLAQSGPISMWRTPWQQGRSALDFVSHLLRGTPVSLALPPCPTSQSHTSRKGPVHIADPPILRAGQLPRAARSSRRSTKTLPDSRARWSSREWTIPVC